MKKNIIYTLMIFSLILVFNINILAEESEKESDNPAIDLNKVSYSIGYDIGKSLKKQDISINSENFIKGFKDGLSGISSDMTDTDMKNALMSFQKQMMEKQQMKFQEVSETNKAKGEKYRTEFKNQPGVIELPSGILYKVIKESTGDKPKDTDTIVANYIGSFVDGKEFDNSYKRGEPIEFVVSGVIPGWTEILQLMPVGSKWKAVIPPDLGYGEYGAAMIGPNETLVFEIELLEIKK